MNWIKACRWRNEAPKMPAPDIPTMNESRARSAICGQGMNGCPFTKESCSHE
jgi:hypothetical protein